MTKYGKWSEVKVKSKMITLLNHSLFVVFIFLYQSNKADLLIISLLPKLFLFAQSLHFRFPLRLLQYIGLLQTVFVFSQPEVDCLFRLPSLLLELALQQLAVLTQNVKLLLKNFTLLKHFFLLFIYPRFLHLNCRSQLVVFSFKLTHFNL